MTPSVLIILLGLILVLALLAGAVLTAPNANKIGSKRLEQIKDRYLISEDSIAKAQMKRILALQETKLDNFVKNFIPRPAELRFRLERTGKDWTLGQYGMICGGTALAATVFFAVLMHVPFLLAFLLGLLAGLGLPHAAVGFLIKKRIDKFITFFPDAIDLLVRGLRSGLPITESLGIVGREIPDPVGIEFRTVADKIRIGKTMEQALLDTTKQIPTPEFQFFVITLAIQRETGGNLAETLGNLSEVLRKRQQMKLKIRAMSSESKASAYIVGALPFIVFGLIWTVSPTYLANFFVDPRLIVAGLGALTWMGIGVGIMAKMVSFEI